MNELALVSQHSHTVAAARAECSSLNPMQGYNDPQTEADRRVERCIVATLATRFPNITIIGEEVNTLLYTRLYHTREQPK